MRQLVDTTRAPDGACVAGLSTGRVVGQYLLQVVVPQQRQALIVLVTLGQALPAEQAELGVGRGAFRLLQRLPGGQPASTDTASCELPSQTRPPPPLPPMRRDDTRSRHLSLRTTLLLAGRQARNSCGGAMLCRAGTGQAGGRAATTPRTREPAGRA